MTLLPAALLLVSPLFAGAPAAPKPADVAFDVLQPGAYSGEIQGMLCWACAEALRLELSRIEGLDKVVVDFESRKLSLTVLDGRKVPVSTVQKALRRSSQRIDLGNELLLEKLRYAS